jgi:hypothetical protein
MKKRFWAFFLGVVLLVTAAMTIIYKDELPFVRQPFLGEDSEQAPKTDFSNLSLEQIELLVEREKGYRDYQLREEKYERDMQWLNAEIEKIQKILNNDNVKIVTVGQKKIVLEVMSNVYINGIVPHIYVDTKLTGEVAKILRSLFNDGLNWSDLLSDRHRFTMYDGIQWIKYKPDERVVADQNFIRSLLLGVKDSEIEQVYGILEEYFTEYVIHDPNKYSYNYEDDKCILRTADPSEELLNFYEASE